MVGHFGSVASYVPATARSYITTTGQTIGAPNDTAGMHARMSGVRGLRGMETWFNFTPQPATDWITNVPNGYIVVGGALVVALAMMR